MSYATSLLAAYPPSYGPSTLLSDNLVTRSSYDTLFPPAVPYMSSGRLLSDDLAFNQITHDSRTPYRPPLYSLSNDASNYSAANYQNPPAAHWRKPVPPSDSYTSLNDITEYSDSLATASNTNTASSVARSINDNHMNGTFTNYTRPVKDADDPSPFHNAWQSPQTKKKGPVKSKPAQVTNKRTPSKPSNDDNDVTPVPSPRAALPLSKQQNPHHPANGTTTEKEKPPVDVEAWLNDTEKGSPVNEKAAEEAWSMKVEHLNVAKAQREKAKSKSSRALPTAPKKPDHKPVVPKTKANNELGQDSYFDSLFDGDFFRKPSTNDHLFSSSFPNPTSTKNKRNTNSFNHHQSTNLSKNPKYASQRKLPRYEPPVVKRAPPNITTTSWRKQWPRQYPFDGTYPCYLHEDYIHRDLVHKDTDERYREALQKLRADRAEQQQKEIHETTAKRLHYGDYIRHTSKDTLLQNAVKPSPWSDFMDLKKGNLYSLSQEEKKQLYKQSKSYGERVRYRNFAIHYGAETARSHRHSVPLLDDVEEYESGNETPRQVSNNGGSKSVSRASKRPESGSTVKTASKNTPRQNGNRMMPNQIDRTTSHSHEDEDGHGSDYGANRKHKQQQPQKKRNVHYAKYDSSGRTTNGPEDSDNETDEYSQRNTHGRNRDGPEDLFTVREEKTLESFEGAQYKKR